MLLTIDRARKQFGGVIAVNDVSFDVGTGEIVALIGPNGAGKSTTFNLITGVLTATGGNISVLGRNIDNAPPHDVVNGLGAGKESEVLFKDILLKKGEHTLKAVVDPEHKIDESKDNNNDLKINVRCTTAP